MFNINYALDFLEQKLVINDKPLPNARHPEIIFCGLSGVPIDRLYVKRVVYSLKDYDSWEHITADTDFLFDYSQDMKEIIINAFNYDGSPYTAIYSVMLDDGEPHFSVEKGILVNNSISWNYFAMKMTEQ